MKLISIQELVSNIQFIETASYTLKPLKVLNSKTINSNLKDGFLLKIAFKNFGIGYADCFSWEVLGDLSLKQQIINLKNGIYDTHLEKSIYFAWIDAQYRSKNQNIFKNLNLPKNHYTCVDINELTTDFIEELKSKGFSKIKIKCGFSLNDEIYNIKNLTPILKRLKMFLRLDFNSNLDVQKFFFFLSSLESSLEIFDFIEDPISFDNNDWEKIKNNFSKINLAIDRIQESFLIENDKIINKSYDYLVMKPAIQNINKIIRNNYLLKKNSILFTSYMDHPIGQLSALYEASLFYSETSQNMEDCGFLTHILYDKNAYSETLTISDTKLIPSFEGNGFGFDALLEKECWRKLE